MDNPNHIQRVRIYLREDDRHAGEPLYLAVLQRLRQSGATGATAIAGLAGFGPGEGFGLGTANNELGRRPVVIEWIDRAEHVARLLPLLDELIGKALVTREEIAVHRAQLRSHGPFAAEQSAGDLVSRPLRTLPPTATLSAALALIVDGGMEVVPVIDSDQRLLGLVSAHEFAWRVGLRLPPHLLPRLATAEHEPFLAPLAQRTVAEIMSPDPRRAAAHAPIAFALMTLIETVYNHLPLVDQDGRLVGMLTQNDILRAAATQASPTDEHVRDANPLPRVALVMQTSVPRLALGQPLALALGQLVADPARSLLVVDDAGRLVGTFDTAAAVAGLSGELRDRFLAALRQPQASLGSEAGAPLDALIAPPPPAIGPGANLIEAAQRLLELGVDQLPVVDPDRKLLGIIAVGGLVRALLQQSE